VSRRRSAEANSAPGSNPWVAFFLPPIFTVTLHRPSPAHSIRALGAAPYVQVSDHAVASASDAVWFGDDLTEVRL
jgi:hypothetical protein